MKLLLAESLVRDSIIVLCYLERQSIRNCADAIELVLHRKTSHRTIQDQYAALDVEYYKNWDERFHRKGETKKFLCYRKELERFQGYLDQIIPGAGESLYSLESCARSQYRGIYAEYIALKLQWCDTLDQAIELTEGILAELKAKRH